MLPVAVRSFFSACVCHKKKFGALKVLKKRSTAVNLKVGVKYYRCMTRSILRRFPKFNLAVITTSSVLIIASVSAIYILLIGN